MKKIHILSRLLILLLTLPSGSIAKGLREYKLGKYGIIYPTHDVEVFQFPSYKTNFNIEIKVNRSDSTNGLLFMFVSTTEFFDYAEGPWFGIAYIQNGTVVFKICTDSEEETHEADIVTVMSDFQIFSQQWNSIIISIEHATFRINVNGHIYEEKGTGLAPPDVNYISILDYVQEDQVCNVNVARIREERWATEVPPEALQILNGCIRKFTIQHGEFEFDYAFETDNPKVCQFEEGCDIGKNNFWEKSKTMVILICAIFGGFLLIMAFVCCLLKILSMSEKKQGDEETDQALLKLMVQQRLKLGPLGDGQQGSALRGSVGPSVTAMPSVIPSIAQSGYMAGATHSHYLTNTNQANLMSLHGASVTQAPLFPSTFNKPLGARNWESHH